MVVQYFFSVLGNELWQVFNLNVLELLVEQSDFISYPHLMQEQAPIVFELNFNAVSEVGEGFFL